MRKGRRGRALEGGMTQYDVAKVFGVSRSRIMQIEQKALAKLGRALRAIGIDAAPAPTTAINWWGEQGSDADESEAA